MSLEQINGRGILHLYLSFKGLKKYNFKSFNHLVTPLIVNHRTTAYEHPELRSLL